MVHQADSIKVNCKHEYTLVDIDNLYENVFNSIDCDNTFLSKHWMIPWLESIQHKPTLFTFEHLKQTIGFVFIGKKHTRIGNEYYLNQSGIVAQDQIWIEYNDVICNGLHKECRIALLDALSIQGAFRFIGTNLVSDVWHHENWQLWTKETHSSYKTNFSSESPSFSLSKNTKSQISRATNYIQKTFGQIKIIDIGQERINEAFTEISDLHIKKWGNHEYGSGFTNPYFLNFHKQFIARNIGFNVKILEFKTDIETLGYLYYLVDNKPDSSVLYFYLSAINYIDSNNKFKPGMVMHKLAMEYFSQNGYSEYDFLAGYARYKTSLSNTEYPLFNIHLFRNKWYYWLFNQAAKFRRYLNERRA